jgi:thermostable 8-oxoguanine DNA glycosylase
MIDPFKPQNFNATTEELEEILLFCVVVAGKTATTQSKLLDEFLNQNNQFYWMGYLNQSPFNKLKLLYERGDLFRAVKASRLGKYTMLSQTFAELATGKLDLHTCTVTDLEAITGIGPKTARFFMLCTRPNIEVAALDTHILKFLADKGHKVPKATPSRGELYNRLEKLFLAYATIAEKSPQEFDLEIWKKYTKSTP